MPTPIQFTDQVFYKLRQSLKRAGIRLIPPEDSTAIPEYWREAYTSGQAIERYALAFHNIPLMAVPSQWNGSVLSCFLSRWGHPEYSVCQWPDTPEAFRLSLRTWPFIEHCLDQDEVQKLHRFLMWRYLKRRFLYKRSNKHEHQNRRFE